MLTINKLAFFQKAIVVHNDKGGVGKSTMSLNIHFAIQQMTGLVGHFVDADAQETSVEWMDERVVLGLETPEYIGKKSALIAHVQKVASKHDFLTVDTPGADTPASREAMTFADVLIIPVNASGFVVNKLVPLLEKVALSKSNNPNMKVFIVFNMVEKKNTAQIRKHKSNVQAILDELLEKYETTSEEAEIYICETCISHKPKYYDQMTEGRTIFEVAQGKTTDPFDEYTALLGEIQDKFITKIEVAA